MRDFYNPMKLFIISILIIMLGMGNCLFAESKVASPPDTVYLQLKWKHQFQFAGYYAAIEKGFYADAGLHVILLEAESGDESIPAVVKGEVQYGISTSDLLLARNSGFPVVLLANIFQHSPLVFLSLKHGYLDNIHDLSGKTIMLEDHATELMAYLAVEQIPEEHLSFTPHSFTPGSLINGDVYAMSAYSTDEPFLLLKDSIEFTVFNPRSGGIDFYSDLLFTSQSEIENHPERVEAFLNASLKGWEYALENDDEIINVIYHNYSKRHSMEHLKFEADQTKRLIMPEVVEIGYVNVNRWLRIGEIYAELGMMPEGFSLDGFVFDRDPDVDYSAIYYTGGIVFFIVLLISFVALRFYRLNLKLKHESGQGRKKEEMLISLEARYRNLTENAPFPLFITTTDSGEVLYLNQLASEFFEVSREHALKKNANQFYNHTVDRNLIIDKLKNQGYIRNVEVEMKTASGKTFWTNISSNLISFNGEPAIFSAVLDISERVELEKKLKQANASKDQFFSILAHDLRGPVGNLQAILEYIVDPEEDISKQEMQKLLLASKEMAQSTFGLLENLLWWARSQKGEIKIQLKRSNICELIDLNLQLVSPGIKQKNIKIVNHCPPSLEFDFDKEMVSTIVRNLLNNAVKYSENNGQIEISIQMIPGSLEVKVQDKGIGMDEPTLRNLFNVKNHSMSQPGTRGEKGTGLGLILCETFVAQHGGKIWVESVPGEGSSFYFTLPIKPPL